MPSGDTSARAQLCPGQSYRHVSRVTAIATLCDGDCAAALQPCDPFLPPPHSVWAGDTPSSVTPRVARVSVSHLTESII